MLNRFLILLLVFDASLAQATQDVWPNPMGPAPAIDSIPVTMATDQPPIAVTGTVVVGGVVFNFGTPTTALRTAAQIGNTTGAADFGAGNASAQTVRTVIASDQVSIPMRLHDATDTGITSQLNGGQQALDIGIVVAGVQIDPRLIRPLTAADVVTANIGTTGGLALDSSIDGLEASASSIDTKLSTTNSTLSTINTNMATATNQTAVIGSKAPGTAAASSVLAGCVYNAAGVTLSNGQQAACQANVSGAVKVDPNFTVVGGALVPSISNKFRVRYSTTPAVVGSAYSTIYTRSGTGLFFGFQSEFNSANVRLRITVDSQQIFEGTVADLKLFQFNDTSTTRIQMGGFWTTIGNTIDFSLKYGMPYLTSVTIEMQRSDVTNHQMNQYIVFLTEDT